MKVKNDFCSKLFLGPILTMAAGLLLTFGLILVGSVVCQQTEVEAKAKAKVITVKKIDQKTAKKVHQQLLKGKAFTIRFKGGEKSFYKKFQKLTKKVAKQTDVGFDVFPICAQDSGYYGSAGFDKQDNKPKKSGKYTKFLIRKAYCEEYIYGIKFAEREYGAMKAYVDKIIAESESTYQQLLSDSVRMWPLNISEKVGSYISDAKYTLSEYKELRQYLQKTKFRDLSGTMKARIALEVGGTDTNDWVKVSMVHKERGFKRCNSFKDLYRRTAYGRELYVAHVICKMCAVYNIGEFECYGRASQINRIPVRVKMKTRSGKIRYAIYVDGTFGEYDKFIGSKIREPLVRYRKCRKNTTKKLKKISKTQQMKQQIAVDGYEQEFSTVYGEPVLLRVYKISINRSEW